MKNLRKFVKENFWLIFSLIYVLSPLDLIPDILLPLIGPLIVTDDAIVLIAAIAKKLWDHYKSSQTKS